MSRERDSELLALLIEDQAEDRNVVAGTSAYAALRSRDRARRDRVTTLISGGWPEATEPLYAAAWVMNHGDSSDEAMLGHQLAAKGRDLGHRPSRWLAAAALDRALMYEGKPQKYGTNIVPDGFGYRLWDVDPDTTDRERIENDVPPLAEMQARAAGLTAPQPPMDTAPQWLKTALERWKTE